MTAFGTMLKDIRQGQRFSQLDLACEANISSKHISFLETGRANPSKEMVLHIARVFNMDHARTNQLLSAAGYSQVFSKQDLNSPEMKIVKEAVEHLLNAHMPYPALLFDKDYNLLQANAAQLYLIQQMLLRGAKINPDSNLFLAFFQEGGLRPFLENWEMLACHMLQRIHQEHLTGPYRDQPNTLLEKALELPDVPKDWRDRSIEHLDKPVLPFTLKLGDIRLNMFSTISSFGTALDVTTQHLRIEHFFPADEATKEYWLGVQEASRHKKSPH